VRGGTSPEGSPIGVQVVARPWREDIALAVAQHLETVLGGWQRLTYRRPYIIDPIHLLSSLVFSFVTSFALLRKKK